MDSMEQPTRQRQNGNDGLKLMDTMEQSSKVSAPGYADIQSEPLSPYEAIDFVRFVARHSGMYGMFVVGGFVRDEILYGDASHAADVDFTCIYPGRARELAGMVSADLGIEELPEILHRTGTVTIEIAGVSMDFRGDMIHGDFREEMRKLGVDVNPITSDVYSRDFTINTLLRSLQSWKLLDITGMGLGDLDNGIIRTMLPPEIVLQVNPLAALRAARFMLKLGFSVEESLVNAISKVSASIIRGIGRERFLLEMSRFVEYGPEKTTKAFKAVGIDPESLGRDAMDVIRGIPVQEKLNGR
jgi:tRNA nucleotidyltransferase/poly(A) polymerase